MKQAILLALILMLAIGCQSPKSKIKEVNLSSAIEKFTTEGIDSVKISYLNYLNTADGTAAREMVLLNKWSYQDVFDQIDSLTLLDEKYNEQFQLIFNRIDNFCLDHQKSIEDFLILQNELNKKAEVKVIAIRKTKWDKYLDVIEVKTKVRNHTSSTINSITYQLKLRSGNNETYLTLKLALPVTTSYDYSYIYDNEVHAKKYKQLEQLIANGYKYSYQVIQLKQGTETVNLMDHEASKYFAENTYIDQEPGLNQPSDYCPYLDQDDPMVQEVSSLINAKNETIKAKFPHLYNFWVK